MDQFRVLEVRRKERDTNEVYNAAVRGCVTTLNALLLRDPLILNEASLTFSCETPLHISSSLGHHSITRALVENKPLLATELDSLGRSPLHLASAEGHTPVVKLLLEAAAHVCLVRDRDDRIPLHLAAIRGRVEVIRELIRVSPDSAHLPLYGNTVLHLSVKYYHLEALQALVHLLGDHSPHLLNSKDNDGNTILHLAVMLNQLKVVKYLMSIPAVKADTNALNNIGHTPLDALEKCPKDFKTLQIQAVLMEIGPGRAKDPSHVAAAKHVKWLNKCFNSSLRYLTVQDDWITETHGNLMVVATVIATMSFQAAISPPGGVWQQDTISSTDGTIYRGGTAVLAYGDTKEGYTFFSDRITVSFVASLCIILLHFGGFPLKNRIGTWLVTIAMCVTLTSILVAYSYASTLVTPTQNRNDLTLANLKTSFAHSSTLGIIWILLLSSVTLVHTIRVVYWLVFEKLSSYTNSDSYIWFKVVISIVLSVIPSAVILFVFFSN